jgi:hypothetical protein
LGTASTISAQAAYLADLRMRQARKRRLMGLLPQSGAP